MTWWSLGDLFPRPSGCNPGGFFPRKQALTGPVPHKMKLQLMLRGDDLIILSYATWKPVQDFPNTVFHWSCFR